MKNRISTMKRTRFQSFQEFGEPITGTGLLLLAGIGGVAAWMMMRGGARKVWFAETLFTDAKGNSSGGFILSGVGATEDEASNQAASAGYVAAQAAIEDGKKPPTVQTRVYKDTSASTSAWLLWSNYGQGQSPVLLAYFTNKDLLDGFMKAWQVDRDRAVQAASSKSSTLKGLYAGNLIYSKEKIPAKYVIGLTGSSGLMMFGDLRLPKGGVPSAFYKFTNPEEIIL